MRNRRGWRGVFRRVNQALQSYMARSPMDCNPGAPQVVAAEVRKHLEHLLALPSLDDRETREKVIDRLGTIIDCGAEPTPVIAVAREIDQAIRERYRMPPRPTRASASANGGEGDGPILDLAVEGVW